MTIPKTTVRKIRTPCAGKRVASKIVRYQSESSYTGPDEFRLSIIKNEVAPQLYVVKLKVF